MKDFLYKVYSKIVDFYNTSSNKRYIKFLRLKGVSIGDGVYFRYPEHTKIDTSRPTLVTIGNNVDINDYFTIMIHDFGTFVFRNLYHDFVPSSGKVTIGNNIYFGRNVTVLKGVTIGDNCIIGLGSIVTKDIPPNSVACGIPARVICSIDDYYKKRKIESVEESIDYGVSLLKTRNRKPTITDFPEEWALFFREKDFSDYPEMHSIIDWRLKDSYETFWANRSPVFDGFEEFLKEVIKKSNE